VSSSIYDRFVQVTVSFRNLPLQLHFSRVDLTWSLLSRLRFTPCAAPCGFGLCFQFPQVCEICPRVTTIGRRCSRAVDSRKSRAHKQLVQVVSVCRDDDCVISPNRAAAKGTPPTRVNRERLCERLFCELACLAANLDGCIRANAEICCLFCDAVCVNSACLQSRAEKSALFGLAG
jgi:hypothetical protein